MSGLELARYRNDELDVSGIGWGREGSWVPDVLIGTNRGTALSAEAFNLKEDVFRERGMNGFSVTSGFGSRRSSCWYLHGEH